MTDILDFEIEAVQPIDASLYRSRLLAEVAAAKDLAEAESLLRTLESQPAVLKYTKCQTVANAAGIGQAIYDWKLWVESLSNRITLQSNPALRLEASRKTLPEGCEFEKEEIEAVREWLRAKQALTATQGKAESANQERNALFKQAVRQSGLSAELRSQEGPL